VSGTHSRRSRGQPGKCDRGNLTTNWYSDSTPRAAIQRENRPSLESLAERMGITVEELREVLNTMIRRAQQSLLA
jgi:hypothetical protein